MSPEKQILDANSNFATDIYNILSRKKGNIFFSPFSIHAVLSMLYQGSKEETAQLLANTLKNPNAETTAAGYRTAIKRVNSIKLVTLLTANKIYGVKGETKFLQDFEETITKNFESEVEFLDIENPKKAAETVNKWVEEKTKDQIKNIVNDTLFKKKISLVLINAIYFKGEWVSKFKETSTKNDKFYLDGKNIIDVKMMHQKGNYWYKNDEELDAQIIEMPYKGNDVKMMIVLPNDNNLEKLEEKVRIEDLGKNLKLTDVHLFVPKFKMEETANLNGVLSELGLKPIFDMNKANFGDILDTPNLGNNLYVSEVVQKAFIEVNEGGTVAAAATRAALVLGCAPGAPKTVIFKVDHPAIFLLVSTHGEQKDILNVLFYGRLSHPEY